jgi:hypothetical protein
VPTWDTYINPEELADTFSYYNSKVGDSRAVDAQTAVKVAQQACNYYSYLSSEEIADAIRYDVQSFAEFATTGFNVTDELEFHSRYQPLLASGHPDSSNPNKEKVAEWISGAPEISDRARDAIVAALSPEVDEVTLVHANTRLVVMAREGLLSDATMVLLERALSSN